MPKIQTKIEGRGNGIRTCVTNIQSVADALRRPVHVLTKFLGIELGAQSCVNDADGRATIMGSHTADSIQARIEMFIRHFVLCPACNLPETTLVRATHHHTPSTAIFVLYTCLRPPPPLPTPHPCTESSVLWKNNAQVWGLRGPR
jgi:hypothetical protein